MRYLQGISRQLHSDPPRLGRRRPAWFLAGPFVVAALALALVWIGGSDTASAHYFAPCYEASLASPAPGAGSDITTVFGVGIGPDCVIRSGDDNPKEYNFGGVVGFTPPEWGVLRDADLPDGTKVGTLSSSAVLGVLNNPCQISVFVDFDLLDGTTNTGNTIDAKPPGEKDRLKPLSLDSDGNGIKDGVEKWPSYLTDVMTDVMANVDPSKLVARLIGINTRQVPGTTVVLNFLVFEPGTKVSRDFDFDPSLGYPSVTVLQDPSAPVSPQDPVNDFCAPLYSTTTTLAAARTNPAAGTYNFVVFAASLPDADDDGIENQLDPCPLTPDPNWDPRGPLVQNPGEQDGDGIPDSCDPFPTEPSKGTAAGLSNSDEDGDGWMNRNDNCGIVANPTQQDADRDGLGDECDPDPSVRTGHSHFQCLVQAIDVGAGGTPAVDPLSVPPCATAAAIDPGSSAGGGGGEGAAGGGGAGGTSVLGEEAAREGSAGVAGGPASGVGALAPVAGGIPVWSALLSGLGGAGLLGLAARAVVRLRRRIH